MSISRARFSRKGRPDPAVPEEGAEAAAPPAFSIPPLPSVLGPRIATDPEPSRVTTGLAVLRHPVLAALAALVVLLPVTVLAFGRSPVYTAEARLLVGQIDVEAQAVPGFVQATQQLASLYARVATTDVVVGPAAAASGLDEDEVRSALRASPVPLSAVIRIEASAADEATAVAIAAAGAEALQAYVTELNDTDPTSSPVYAELEAATAAQAAADVRVRALQGQADSLRDLLGRALGGEVMPQSADLLQVSLDAVEADLVDVTATALQARSNVALLQDEFDQLARGAGDRAGVEIIGQPVSAGSDAGSVRAATLLAAVVGGVLFAFGVVTVRANLEYLASLRRRAVRPGRGGPYLAPRPAGPALTGR